MNYTVKMSEEAENNLKAVIEYISIELKMPHAASNLYYKIKNLIQSLATMPERFKEYDKEKYKSYNLRMVSVDNYCIFYTVDNDNKIVYVTNILYGKMNLNMHLTLEQ